MKKYPKTASLIKSVIQKLIKKLKKMGQVANTKRNRVKTFCSQENIARIKDNMARSSQKSTKRLSFSSA